MADKLIPSADFDTIREAVGYARTLSTMLYEMSCENPRRDEDVNAPYSDTQRQFALLVALDTQLNAIVNIAALDLWGGPGRYAE